MDAFLVDALVFKTGERRKSLVGSIPMHSRHSFDWLFRLAFSTGPLPQT